MQYFAQSQLGPKRYKTPEGFLLCKDVPFARVGEQIYASFEAPQLQPRSDGLIVVRRDPDEVFAPKALASFEGKPVTFQHPGKAVDAESWRATAHGHLQNVHREGDFVVADLLLMDPDTIGKVERDEIREVSAGYDVDYEQLGAGLARQINIRGNHLALVERGRAGPQCAIQDGETTMTPNTPAGRPPIPKKSSALFKRILGAFAIGDADMVESEVTDADEMIEKLQKDNGDLTAALAARDAEIEELKKKVGAEDDATVPLVPSEPATPTGSGPTSLAPGAPTPDQGVLMTGDTLAAVFARAEVIAPGIKQITGDAAADEQTAAAALMRTALADGARVNKGVDALIKGRDVSKLVGDSLAVMFNAAHAVMTATNAAALKPAGMSVNDAARNASTVIDMNAKATAGWATRKHNPL